MTRAPIPDCGEAGHDEGCCGNLHCLPRRPVLSGETLEQREEVCAAWHALPDQLRKDQRLTRLYHALGGPRMDDPAEADPHGVPGRPPTKQEDAVLHHAARAAGKVVAPGKLAEGVPAVDAMKRGAAERVMSGIEAGRRAFRAGKPRDGLAGESERIGWDEAAHVSGVAPSDVTLPKALVQRAIQHLDSQALYTPSDVNRDTLRATARELTAHVAGVTGTLNDQQEQPR